MVTPGTRAAKRFFKFGPTQPSIPSCRDCPSIPRLLERREFFYGIGCQDARTTLLTQDSLMCGISGFLEPRPSTSDELDATAQRMANALRHRGPDDSGTWVDAEVGVALGHRRLSIVDLSPN